MGAAGRAGGGGWREAQGLLGLLDYPERGAGSAGEGEGKGAAGGIPEDATVLSSLSTAPSQGQDDKVGRVRSPRSPRPSCLLWNGRPSGFP